MNYCDSSSKALSLIVFSLGSFLLPSILFSLPQVNEVASGSAQIEGMDSSHLRITTSDKAIINFESFDIAKNEQVTFVQPRAHSAVLNRVKGKNASSLMGRLNGNGRVFLINPNGIITGPSGSINTGSFIASTLDIADSDFLNERFQFILKPGSEKSSILHQGTISCPEGAIALLAPHIRNEGAIMAQAGKVILANGEKITLDFTGDDLISFSIDGEVKKAVIEHLGKIDATGGEVFLKMRVADEALKRIVNTDSLEEANQIIEENGVVRLVAKSRIAADVIHIEGRGHTEIDIAGSLDASRTAEGKTGGDIQIFGDKILLVGAEILASGQAGGGSVLIGGDYQGSGERQKASYLAMDELSTIYADAEREGPGGRIILWSEESTTVEGKIFARGGALSGDGGFVETSGHEWLSVTGQVNTSAPHGEMGSWLLDPTTLIVQTGGAVTGLPLTCADTSTPTLDPSYIGSQTSTVILCATSNAATAIQVLSPITMTTSGAGLTFQTNGGLSAGTTLSANITTNNGPVNFASNGPSLTLGNSVVIDTTNGGLNTGALVSFEGVTGSTHNLTINAGTGTVTFNPSITGVVVNEMSISSTGGITVDVTSFTTTGRQFFNGPVTIGAPTFTTTNSPIYFSSTINGNLNSTLTINAGNSSIFVGGNIGAGAISGVVMTGNGGIELSNITTTSGLGGNGTIALTSHAGILLNGADYITATSSGSFTATGNVLISGNTTITTSGATVHITGTVDGATSGAGSLSIGTSGGGITIGGDIGTGASLTGLTLNAGSGAISVGSVGNSAVGSTGGLSFSASGGSGITLNGGIYNTSGASQLYNNSVVLGVTTTLTSTNQAITFSGGVTGAQELTVNAGTSTVTLGPAIGSFSVGNLSVTASGGINANYSSIVTTGRQFFNGPVAIGTQTTFTTTNSPVYFASTVDGNGGTGSTLTITAGTGSIFVGGNIGETAGKPLYQVAMTGYGGIEVSNITASNGGTGNGNIALTSHAGILLNGTTYTTATNSGTFTATGNVSIGSAAVITTSAAAVQIEGTVDSTITGAGSLSIGTSGGAITITGDIGTAASLTGCTLNAGSSTLSVGGIGNAAIGSTGGLSFSASGGIALNGNGYTTSGASQAYNNNVTLGATTILTSTNQPITFSGTINGAQGLTVNTGTNTVTFNGAIGSLAPLSNLIIFGSGSTIVHAPSIATSGNQFYGMPVSLGLSANFTTANSPVYFASTINDNAVTAGTNTLTISAGIGSIFVGGNIGATQPLGQVTMTGNGGIGVSNILTSTAGAGGSGAIELISNTGIFLNGTTYTTASISGAFIATGNITLGANTSITISSAAANINGSIDGDGVSTRNLTLNSAGGDLVITGMIGGRISLGTLSLNSNNISIGGIGGLATGVTGTTALTAITNINFTGSMYFANNATYTAGTNFNILQTVPINFNSLVGPITFVNGTVNLSSDNSPLVLTTRNANIFIPKIAGSSIGHLLLDAGTGTVTIGDASGPVFDDIEIVAGSISLTGALNGNSINIVSSTSILNNSIPVTLTALDVILLNALGGDVGSPSSPISISASGGIAVVGATGNAWIDGITGDTTVHCLPNNPPQQLVFNAQVINCTQGQICPVCPSLSLFTLTLPVHFEGPRYFAGGGIFNSFDFTLAADFFFLEDRAAYLASCDSNVYDFIHEPDVQCMYNKTFWYEPSAEENDLSSDAYEPSSDEYDLLDEEYEFINE